MYITEKGSTGIYIITTFNQYINNELIFNHLCADRLTVDSSRIFVFQPRRLLELKPKNWDKKQVIEQWTVRWTYKMDRADSQPLEQPCCSR